MQYILLSLACGRPDSSHRSQDRAYTILPFAFGVQPLAYMSFRCIQLVIFFLVCQVVYFSIKVFYSFRCRLPLWIARACSKTQIEKVNLV